MKKYLVLLFVMTGLIWGSFIYLSSVDSCERNTNEYNIRIDNVINIEYFPDTRDSYPTVILRTKDSIYTFETRQRLHLKLGTVYVKKVKYFANPHVLFTFSN